MTKADRIRALYAEGKTVREIADLVGCRREYVRVVAQQRANGPSNSDRRYWQTEKYKIKNRAKSRRHYWKKKAEKHQSVASP